MLHSDTYITIHCLWSIIVSQTELFKLYRLLALLSAIQHLNDTMMISSYWSVVCHLSTMPVRSYDIPVMDSVDNIYRHK